MSKVETQPEVVPTMRNEHHSDSSGLHEPAASSTTAPASSASETSRSASGSGSGGRTIAGEAPVGEKAAAAGQKGGSGVHGAPIEKARGAGASGSKKAESKGALGKLEAKLPDWFTRAIRTPRMWKNFTRCMVATFATLVLMLVQSSLNTLGQAAFFGLIVSQMLPPSMALSVYIFAFMTLVIGMCMGWAWGCAAMAAALRARSQTLLASAVQRETATYTQSTNLDAQYQASIFHGAFLDPRSSTVFGIFLFIGAYACGFLRAKMPRLTLAAIFATIILDLMCSYGPLFPISQYTLANNLLIPAACFLAIALASTILIFPQSLHSIVMTQLTDTCFIPIKALLDLQGAILSASPNDRDTWADLAEKAYGLRKAHVMGVAGVDGQTKLLGLEISRGRLGAVELVMIIEKQKELGARAYSLASFVLVITIPEETDEQMIVDERSKALAKLKDTSDAHHRRRKEYVQKVVDNQHPGTALDDLIPILASSTASLRSAASDGLSEIISYLNGVNHSRWGKFKGSPIGARQEALARLRSSLDNFRSEDVHAILAPFADTFDDQGRLRTELVGKMRYSARDLFTCYILTTGLAEFSRVLIELMELVIKLEDASSQNKWHFPTNIGKAISENATDKQGGNPLDMPRDASEETLVGGEAHEDDEKGKKGKKKNGKGEKKKTQKTWAKDPDASDPRNALQRFGRGLYALWRGLTGVNGIFALKYGIVTMALWTPQVIGNSAYFVYTNRGLWALIMAQTGMGVYTGEQIGSFFLRMGGTILGLIIGMVAWYVGAGHGSGNPYGIAASTMVFVALPLFIRISAPMQSPPMITALMTGVTITFVVGYSWVDEHIYQLANQGSGASLAGRRALLVIIAAFIVMLFPKPTSARKIVRLSLSRNLLEISNLYASVIGGWEEEVEWEDEDGSDGKNASEKRKERRLMYRERFTHILERMGSITPQMSFARQVSVPYFDRPHIEPGLKGPWPKERYEELQALQLQIVSALALLAAAYGNMDLKWAKRLESRSELMHPAFIADYLALFALLHQSLRNGHPLPSTMPIFERLGYHSQYRHHRQRHQAHSDDHASKTGSAAGVEKRHEGQTDVDASITPSASSINIQLMEGEARLDKQEAQVVKDLGSDFTFNTMKDEQFAVFSVANVALIHITSCLNEMHLCIKQLVGERELAGFEQTQERWARLEMTSV